MTNEKGIPENRGSEKRRPKEIPSAQTKFPISNKRGQLDKA